MSEDYSDWRNDLIEVSGYNVDNMFQPRAESEESDKEITVKKVNNKVTINPNMREFAYRCGSH